MAGPSALTEHLGYWLRLVSNAVSGRFAVTLAERGVSVAEWVLMRALFDVDEELPSRLALRMGMTKGGVSKLADRLVARGLVARRAGRDDGRTAALALTPEGRALVPELAALADENDVAFFGTLAPEARQQLRAVLEAIATRHQIGKVPIE